MQHDQRAQALLGVFVVDKLQRGLNAASGFSTNLLLVESGAGIERFAENAAQGCGGIEDIVSVKAENVLARNFKEAPRRLRHEDGAPIAGEEQDAILKVAENLVEIFSQRGEDLLHITHALADALDLCGNLGGRILPGRGFRLVWRFAARSAITINVSASLRHGA